MQSAIIPKIVLATQIFGSTLGLAYLVQPTLNAQTTDQTTETRKADRQLTQKIRKAVVGDKTLSIEAHNVNISTQDGMVTLKGTVKSDEEKKAIEDRAAEIAGQGKVTSELTIAPPKS